MNLRESEVMFLIAELIFDNQVKANDAELALCKAGFKTEQRPDWDDACGGGCAWLTASTAAADAHAFYARVAAIIAPDEGMIWVCGTHEFNAEYNDTLEVPVDLQ